MRECGLTVNAHRHEAATAGQGVVVLESANLLSMADNVMKYKYIVKNVAKKHGKTATFMPKPIYQEHGSGMNVQPPCGRRVSTFSRALATLGYRAWRNMPLAACSSMLPLYARLPIRLRTATNGWCPGMMHR